MPKIIGDSLADHRTMTRARLFEALGQLMSEQPFDTITMSQIATHAGVGRTAVYNHFADKETLLLAFMRHASGQFTQVLRDTLAGHDDPVEQIRIYLRAHIELKDRYHLAAPTALNTQVSQKNASHLRDHVDIISEILLGILRHAMEMHVIPLQNPYTLLGLTHAALAGVQLPPEQSEREKAIRITEVFILRALGVAESALPPLPPVSREHLTHSGAEQNYAHGRCPAGHGN